MIGLLRRIKTRWQSLRQRSLYMLIAIGLIVPNILFALSPYLGPYAKIANLLLPLGWWLITLSLSRKPGKVLLWWLPLVVAINAFQLVLFSVFWGEVIAVDMLLNLFSASGDEAGELLGGLLLPIILTLLVTSLLIALGVRSLKTSPLLLRERKQGMRAGAALLLVGLIPLWLAHRESPAYSLRASVYPVNVFYNMYVSAGKLREVLHYDETSRGFSYEAHSAYPDDREIYIFVLGETSRAHSWQINGYDRETTPRLMARRDQLAVFADLTTESNTTYKSAPIILSPADAEHSDRLPSVKGIMTAMKEAGFHTVYISNQPENRSFLDFFAYEADEHYRIRDIIRKNQSLMDRKPVYDGDMLPFLRKAIGAGHRKLFVILHAYGSHWSYRDRYPRDHAHFVPDDALGANQLERDKLVNAYDNAVRYTDFFLDEVITTLEQQDAITAMYYTADHGEDVFDDERGRILHSSPSVSYYQLHVPGVLWMSSSYRSARSEQALAALAHQDMPASSGSTFHTLLDVAGVETRELRPERSLVNPLYTAPTPRVYLNDRYECVPLSEMLTHPLDQEAWRKAKLRPES